MEIKATNPRMLPVSEKEWLALQKAKERWPVSDSTVINLVMPNYIPEAVRWNDTENWDPIADINAALEAAPTFVHFIPNKMGFMTSENAPGIFYFLTEDISGHYLKDQDVLILMQEKHFGD
jgi:hypothetical protein